MEGLDYIRYRVSWTDIKGGGPTIAIVGERDLPRLDDLKGPHQRIEPRITIF